MFFRTLVVLFLCCVAVVPMPAAAASYTLDIIDDAIKRPGDVLSFAYRIDNAAGLATIDLLLPYDPLVLKYRSASSALFPDAPWDSFTANDEPGTGVRMSGVSFAGLSGTDQTLVTIEFMVCMAPDCPADAPVGTINMGFGTVELSVYQDDGSGFLLPVPVAAGDIDARGSATLTVLPAAATPGPAPWLLLLPGLLALSARRRQQTAALTVR